MTSLKNHLVNMLTAGLTYEVAKAEKIGAAQKFSSAAYQQQVARALVLKLARDRVVKQDLTI